MAEMTEISKIVHTITGVAFDICLVCISHLIAETSNPMFLCSRESFRRWYTFQYLGLVSAHSIDRMVTALMPIRPANVDKTRIEELVGIGTEALLDLANRRVDRLAKTINLLWLVALIQSLDEELHQKLSRNVVSFYHREPDVLHRAAGHGPIIDWLEDVSKGDRHHFHP